MKKIIYVLVFLLSASLYSQEKLTNESIVELVQLGFDSDIIKSKINSMEADFKTEIVDLKILKENGVTSDVIALMIDKSKVKIVPGIYYYANDVLKLIEPSVFSGTKSNALGAALTYGIAPAKMKSYVHNASSMNIPSKQEFVFQFDVNNKSNEFASNQMNNWWFKSATSPNEFVLTPLTKKKNQRELVTGKMTMITASTQLGIDSKNTISFTFENLGNGRYKVIPNIQLPPGEYCFFYQGTIPMGGFTNQSIFDFSIN